MLIIIGSSCEKRDAQPNIILFLADDMGYGDPQCYMSNSKIPTPHIDRLASDGMRFTDAHSPASVCSPTRYAILTGCYAWRTHMKKGVLRPYNSPLIEPERLTLTKILQQKGYKTACIGKWHLGMQWATKHNLWLEYPEVAEELRQLLTKYKREGRSTGLILVKRQIKTDRKVIW